ncbi:hypothetical protein E4U43_007523 [Claviceps pusilla]|uniref:Mitochondrial ATP-dependent helicase irc3 n=1 Tax=Claviceps pusilla TaxID=123648 RepID=A0A9P7NCB4_9HYPO|nr:hypothetical protein E4U43_007523 [Claviceps pusilla]
MLRFAAKCVSRLTPRITAPVRPLGSVAPPHTFAFKAFTASLTLDAKPKLRDYQQDCINSVLSSLERGHKRVGISLATGAGKTVVFTQLIDKVHARSDGGGNRTLILAHRRELVEQAARHCQLAYPDKTIEIEMGSLHASGAADITIASVQSITSRDRLEKYAPREFKLVLVDEAHHIVAPGYLKTLEHFGLRQKQQDSPTLIGVSATFSRFDGVKLGAAIDEIVYHRDYVDMITDKWLSDVIFTTVESSANLSKVKSGAFGDFQTGELSKVVNTDEINDMTVKSWMVKAAGRKSTLVFCVDLAHVSGLTRKFREYGYDARFVTGETAKLERSATLDAFKKGEFPVLVNCGVFTEGTDIPNIDCIVLGRPTRSRNLLVQMIGRGMRLHPGKENCHVIDLVSSLDTGIVTTPTLFGLDPNELVDKASVAEMREMKERKIEEASRPPREAHDVETEASSPDKNNSHHSAAEGAVTFTDYSSVLDLIADTSGERHIRSISLYSWVQVGPQRFVLSAPSGSYLRIERMESTTGATATAASSSSSSSSPPPSYRAVEIRALRSRIAKSPYAAPREILKAATFDDAVHGADKYAANAFPHTFIHRYQPWRQLPATKGQLAFVNKLRGKAKALTASDLTKGRAADMITKLKLGARGHFAKIEAEQRRKVKLSSLLASRQNRERVVVGPLMP